MNIFNIYIIISKDTDTLWVKQKQGWMVEDRVVVVKQKPLRTFCIPKSNSVKSNVKFEIGKWW